MQRLNNSAWSFGAPTSSPQAILNPAQFLMMQQQLHQTNNQQNFDIISAFNQQQQQFLNHQQLQQRQQQNSSQLQKTSSPMMGSTFSSPFSVNSLLNSGFNKLVQQQANQQVFAQQHSNNQQLAAAMLTQHLATAMANYRMQQQQLNKAGNQQRSPPTHPVSDSAFQAPAKKKQKLNESSSETNELIQNSSMCSISSPSSSSTSSAYSSSSISFDYHNPDYHTNHLDYMNNLNNNNNNNKSSMDSNVSISLNCGSQVSLNESNEFQDEQQLHQSESERNTPISYNFNEQKTPSSVRRSSNFKLTFFFIIAEYRVYRQINA